LEISTVSVSAPDFCELGGAVVVEVVLVVECDDPPHAPSQTATATASTGAVLRNGVDRARFGSCRILAMPTRVEPRQPP